MKKNVFAIITSLILLISMFASMPVIADTTTAEEIGGLDFYSITVHYENPVLVSLYKTKIEVENDKGKKTKVDVEYFYNTNAESEDGKYVNDKGEALTADKLVIPAGTKSIQNFYQTITDSDASSVIKSAMWYSKLPYKNAFLTHITNGSGICTTGKVDLFGITDVYDDAPYEHQNPNFKYADDGYALAAETDENGTQLKIDINGYLVDTANNIWKTSNGERVELYTQVPVIKKTGEFESLRKCPACNKRKPSSEKNAVWTCSCGQEVKGDPVTMVALSDTYEWVSFNDRIGENGKIVDIQTLEYDYMVTEEEYTNFLSSSENVLNMYRVKNTEDYDKAPKNAKYTTYVQTCLVDKEKTPDTYWSTDRQFTTDDIVRDENGYIAYGTPKVGTPVLNAKVKDITVEIDALGAQTYDDLASDPQQKNTITISINDCDYNANLYKQWFDEGLYTQEEYDELCRFVVGTAKSKTTRTEVNINKGEYKDDKEYGYSPTVASVSIGASAEILAKLPQSAKIYIDFDINEQQPEAAWDETYQKKMLYKEDGASSVINAKVTTLTDADKPVKKAPIAAQNDGGFPTWAIFAIAGGAVVIVAVVVVVIILLKKKKK